MLWIRGLLIAAAGISAFYEFAVQVIAPVRALGMLAAIVVGALVVSKTVRGRDFFLFLKEADVERRKVVWPTRNETLQTTLVVIVITLIVAFLLFLMDAVFGWVVRHLIGSGGG